MIDNKNSKTDKSRKESFPKVHVNWDIRIFRKIGANH